MALSKKVKQVYVSMSLDELKKELNRISSEYKNMLIQKSIKVPDNPIKIRTTRRLIAFLNTLIREKELGIRK
ncbi:MAG: 50S ribosomal protein L29 [Brevinematia bacterium]|jgi:large subunit ribosomal protein L29